MRRSALALAAALLQPAPPCGGDAPAPPAQAMREIRVGAEVMGLSATAAPGAFHWLEAAARAARQPSYRSR